MHARLVRLKGFPEGAEAVFTYWDSEEALVASRESLAALDRMAPGQELEVLSIEEYEVALTA